MHRIVVCVSFILFAVMLQDGSARDRTLSFEEKVQLQNAQIVLLETIALTERGRVNAQPILDTVSHRLQTLGFKTHTTPSDPYDVRVKVKCEERKTRIGPSRYGGDADSLHAPSRNWKGPACQITFGLDGHDTAWRNEIRTEFTNARRAARKAQVKDSGQYALSELTNILAKDDFPYLLAAEWGQAHRLSQIMEKPDTPPELKRKIIPLLGNITGEEALATLEHALQDSELAELAAMAIGGQGQSGTEVLLSILQTATDPALKVSAVKGLGEIATHNSQAPVYAPFVTTLEQSTTEIPVQTEIVIALGKLADQRAIEPLTALNQKAWTDPSRDPEMQKLREALSWSLWQLNPDAHAGE